MVEGSAKIAEICHVALGARPCVELERGIEFDIADGIEQGKLTRDLAPEPPVRAEEDDLMGHVCYPDPDLDSDPDLDQDQNQDPDPDLDQDLDPDQDLDLDQYPDPNPDQDP